MSWITFDYRCGTCGDTSTEMFPRGAVPELVECTCGQLKHKQYSANIARVSYPDGTTDRFKNAKEKRALDKLVRKAKKAGDKSEVLRLNNEIKTVKEISKRDHQAVNICKVSQKET